MILNKMILNANHLNRKSEYLCPDHGTHYLDIKGSRLLSVWSRCKVNMAQNTSCTNKSKILSCMKLKRKNMIRNRRRTKSKKKMTESQLLQSLRMLLMLTILSLKNHQKIATMMAFTPILWSYHKLPQVLLMLARLRLHPLFLSHPNHPNQVLKLMFTSLKSLNSCLANRAIVIKTSRYLLPTRNRKIIHRYNLCRHNC